MALSQCKLSPLFYSPQSASRAVEGENEYFLAVNRDMKYKVIRCDECMGWHMAIDEDSHG